MLGSLNGFIGGMARGAIQFVSTFLSAMGFRLHWFLMGVKRPGQR